MTITEFCDQYEACAEGREWALAQGVATMAELWELPMRSEWRIWIATRPGVITPQQRVVFACRCVRRVWYRLDDKRSRTAVKVAERWARGKASDDELATASAAARTAFNSAHAAYAADFPYPHESTSAHDSASAHAASAAYAAYAATYANTAYNAVAAAAEAIRDAYFSAERDWQAQEMVNMFGNPFKKGEKK